MTKLLYSLSNLSPTEKFVLIEFPKLLYAGFYWTLEHLQHLYNNDVDLAFSDLVAPSDPTSSLGIPPPKYSDSEDFAFDLSVIQDPDRPMQTPTVTINPLKASSDPQHRCALVEAVKTSTTLDDGQAKCLIDCLSR